MIRKLSLGLLLVVMSLPTVLSSSSAQNGGAKGRVDSQENMSTSFTYQGVLRKDGVPLEGTCDLQFSLWDAAAGGAQIGAPLTLSDETIVAGLFTVQLDFGGTAFSGEARWLAIAVRCPAGTGGYTPLSPRQALTATPYALHSNSAPWTGLSGVPTGFADGVDADTLGGLSCGDGQLAKWNGTAWVCGDDSGGVTYAAGTGLTLSGGEFSVDTAVIQRRVSGSCGPGNAIRQVGADGGVLCEADDDTLGSLSCGDGQIAEWVGGAWV